VVLEAAGPADPAGRYALSALIRTALPRLQHRAPKAVTIHRKGVIGHSDYPITVLEEGVA
jgi:hypothetical protein